MPRATRRSLAAKEEPSTPEPPKSARGRRGAKREKEESPSDEIQETPAKRGRDTAPEQKTPTRGRSRSKKQVEAEEVEEEVEQVEVKPTKGRSQGRSRSKKPIETEPEEVEEEVEQVDKKPTKGRSQGRSRSKKSVEADPEEAEEDVEEQVEMKPTKGANHGTAKSAKGRGSRSRSSRGKSAQVEDESEKEEEPEVKPRGRGGRLAKKIAVVAHENEDKEEVEEAEVTSKSSSGRTAMQLTAIQAEIGDQEEEEEIKSKGRAGRSAKKPTPSKRGGRSSSRVKVVEVESEYVEAEIEKETGEERVEAVLEKEKYTSCETAQQELKDEDEKTIHEDVTEQEKKTEEVDESVQRQTSGGGSSKEEKKGVAEEIVEEKKKVGEEIVEEERNEEGKETVEEERREEIKDVGEEESKEGGELVKEERKEDKEIVEERKDQGEEIVERQRKEDGKVVEEEMKEESEEAVEEEMKEEGEEAVEKEIKECVEETLPNQRKEGESEKSAEAAQDKRKEECKKTVEETREEGKETDEMETKEVNNVELDQKEEKQESVDVVQEDEIEKKVEASVMEIEEEAGKSSEQEGVEVEAAQTNQNMETADVLGVTEEPKNVELVSKKRKLDVQEEENVMKRPKVEDINDGLEDYVVINSDEAPAHDSNEVKECISQATPHSSDSHLKDDTVVNKQVPGSDCKEITDVSKALPTPPTESNTSDTTEKDQMPAPVEIPVVIPLTEAEITKRYTDLHREKEADETSSILVEIGSEANSDIANLSIRGLDVSDATSMDSNTDQASSAPNPQTVDPGSTASQPTDKNYSADPVKEVASLPSPVVKQGSTPAPTEIYQNTPNPETKSEVSKPSVVEIIPLPPAPQSITTALASSPNSPSKHHNGVIETSASLKSPSKPTVPYVPSSTSITKRKFVSNPKFPVELMDPAFCFSVVAYNILAECHLQRGDYSFTEPQYLEQAYRHNLMMSELDYLAGDVVCLQEVDPAYYTTTLLPAMTSRGYEGQFIKRTTEFYNEGEATFVKNSKFEIESTQAVSLKDLAYKEIQTADLGEAIATAARKYLDRADMVLLSKLRCKKTGKFITVGNIHVVYDPKAPDVQCVQVASAIKELVTKAGSDLNPHIICGDFNSSSSSPAYQLATDGYLSDSHIHNLQALETMDNTNGSSRSIINHLWRAFQHTSTNLRSAYKTAAGVEPEVSTFHGATRDSLDYIFHSSASLDTVGVLQTLDPSVVDASSGLPSREVPSDHLSLKAIFRIKDL